MSTNYTLRYRTFDQLLDDVRVDFQNLALENMIEPQQLIKVAKRITYELGLRVFMTKEAVLTLDKGRVKLPDDFYSLNFAFVCDEYSITTPVVSGTHIEERLIENPVKYQCAPPEVIDTCNEIVKPVCTDECVQDCDPCKIKPCVKMNCKGDKYEIVEITRTSTNYYKRFYPITIKSGGSQIDCDCPNLRWNCPSSAWIKDGYLYGSFEDGKIYINYQGMLEDEDGKLLVVDHDLINEYYEYGIKERILENLYFNDESVGKKYELVQAKLRLAKIQATSFVNMPNFSELKSIWEVNRRAQYHKYVDMFKSYENLGYR